MEFIKEYCYTWHAWHEAEFNEEFKEGQFVLWPLISTHIKSIFINNGNDKTNINASNSNKKATFDSLKDNNNNFMKGVIELSKKHGLDKMLIIAGNNCSDISYLDWAGLDVNSILVINEIKKSMRGNNLNTGIKRSELSNLNNNELKVISDYFHIKVGVNDNKDDIILKILLNNETVNSTMVLYFYLCLY